MTCLVPSRYAPIVYRYRHHFLALLTAALVCGRLMWRDGLLGTPVVAAENNNRPDGVFTYPADDPQAMSAAVLEVLDNHAEACDQIVAPEVRDTVGEEAQLLVAAALGESIS